MSSSDIKYPADVADEFFSREKQSHPAASPTQSVLTQLVETMLFASTATEEGHLTRVGIVFAESTAPFQAATPAWDFIRFALSLKLEVNSIAKLASACGSLDSLLVVVPQNETLALVGIATPHERRPLRDKDELVRILVLKPGVISVRRGHREVVRYERGKIHARLPSLFGPGEQWRVQFDSIEQTVFREESPILQVDVVDSFLRIARGMAHLGHGGLLVVLGPQDEPRPLLEDAKRLAEPLQLGAALREMKEAESVYLGNAMMVLTADTFDHAPPEEEVKRNADAAKATASRVTRLSEQIARLTTVDGAVMMSHALEVLAFGVKLPSKEEVPTVYSVTNDRRPGEVWPLATRGTRHRAAAVFAEQHPGGLALILSRDGDAAIVQKLQSQVVYWPLPL